jgi:hypothetical protein
MAGGLWPVLLSQVDPQERLGMRVRVRLRADGACEGLSHDSAEDGRIGTLRRCQPHPDGSSHH